LLIFQGSLREHGFDSDLFYEMSDFKNKVAIVPCSATTGEGVPELLMMLCGLSQKFLKDQLTLGSDAKGVVLEVKKEKNMDCIESILYDGVLKECDEIAIAGFGETVVSKVRALEEIEPLSFKYKCKKEVVASTGIKMHLTEKKGVLSGMPFRKIDGNLEEIKKEFSAEVDSALRCDKQGIIVKADSLGSLEALMSLLRDEQINIVKAGIGPIGKTDLISAKANLEINELDSVIIGFGVDVEEGLELGKVKVISDQVVYKIIEDLGEWRKQRQGEIERERMMGLSSICKLEVLDQYVFRNSNPAIFGVRVVAGKAKPGVSLIKEDGESIARIKQLQLDKDKVDEAAEGSELAIALPGVAFDRRLKGNKFLYSDMGEKQFKAFKKNKDLLSSAELKVLQEIADIKRRKNEEWGL
jgi:translation initiation factor 5B